MVTVRVQFNPKVNKLPSSLTYGNIYQFNQQLDNLPFNLKR